MRTKARAQIGLIIFAILFAGITSFDMYSERKVAYHLIYKDQNALYRLRTVTEDQISDPMALNFVSSEISHIEHGIMILTPSNLEVLLFALSVPIFGYLCYYYGKVKAVDSP